MGVFCYLITTFKCLVNTISAAFGCEGERCVLKMSFCQTRDSGCICAIYPVKTETGLKMEINTKVSKAVLYCSLTPYHFTLKPAVKAALSTVPIKACGKDCTSSQNNRRLNAFTLALRAVPDCSTSPAASRRDANTVSCVFPLVSPSCLYTPVSFLSLRFHLTGEE